MSWLTERIAEKAKQIKQDRYGKRREDDLSTAEIERINHDAAVEVQREIKERRTKP